MSHFAIFHLLVRNPLTVQSVCSRTKLAAPVHGPAESIVGEMAGCAVKLTGCWNDKPLNNRGSTFLEIRGFKKWLHQQFTLMLGFA